MSETPAQILVAEDDPEVLDLVTTLLTRDGHSVVPVKNGAEAVQQVRLAEFDVVVSDVRMPGMDGVAVLRAVKEVSSDTEVVMLSGHANLELAMECMRAGAFDFVPKPVYLPALSATVARAAERRQLRAASLLLETSKAVFSTSKIEELPEVIVGVAVKAMGADFVSLMLPGADGQLYVAHSRGLPKDVEAQVTVGLGERVAGRIAAERAPTLINQDLTQNPRFAAVESFGRVKSSIVYPLVTGERLVGVLNLGRGAGARPFRKADLERASVLASHVLLALENARLVRHMMASESLASIGQVAAGVAHEINNPVSYLLANLRMLRHGLAALGCLLPEQAQENLAELQLAAKDAEEGAGRIRDIVRDMRELARSDYATLEPFQLEDAIRSALRVAGAELRGRAALTTEIEKGLEVKGSAGPMSQVLVNLLVNAGHALKEVKERPKQISVRAFRQGSKAYVEVADTGTGIAPRDQGRLFEPFFTTKDPSTGTGLGLYISREIVRRFGGDIRVRSTFGVGTTFIVELPALDELPKVMEARLEGV